MVEAQILEPAFLVAGGYTVQVLPSSVKDTPPCWQSQDLALLCHSWMDSQQKPPEPMARGALCSAFNRYWGGGRTSGRCPASAPL